VELGAHIAEFDSGRVRRRDGVYVESAAIEPADIAAGARGRVSMRNIGRNGRMANQLLQWAFLNFYAWRHDLSLEAPDFPAASLVGARPAPPAGELPTIAYAPFEDAAALALWERATPIVDVDFEGYFQELPACWAPHRALFRKLLRFGAEAAADRWRAAIPGTLIAVHVRRGDLADPVHAAIPHFASVPLDWYVDWVEAAMARAPGASLYVASDGRPEILPAFARWNPLAPADFVADDRLADLLALSRADALGFGNSSYGRLAGLLAADAQTHAVADFAARALVPCDTWRERSFWTHFGPVPGTVDADARRAEGRARLAARPWRKRFKSWLRRRGI
jgi:hypothetical protein